MNSSSATKVFVDGIIKDPEVNRYLSELPLWDGKENGNDERYHCLISTSKGQLISHGIANSSEKPSVPFFRPTHREKRITQKANPLVGGISSFLSAKLRPNELDDIISSLPSRYMIYPPLLLLPSNTFARGPGNEQPTPFHALWSVLKHDEKFQIWQSILASFAGVGQHVTHIALNGPISLNTDSGHENTIRAPTGLVPLYGDFGSSSSNSSSYACTDEISTPKRSMDEQVSANSTKDDPEALDLGSLDSTLWVSHTFRISKTKITQTWAPMRTMFSRGNLSEKRRILLGQFSPSVASPPRTLHETVIFPGLTDMELGQPLSDVAIVDFYLGTGFFAFPYLLRGAGRVYGFDLSAWACEGARRGAVINGFSCRAGEVCPTRSIRGKDPDGVRNVVKGAEQLVIFNVDNRHAQKALTNIRITYEEENQIVPTCEGQWKAIRHINLGLLPTSSPSWPLAVSILDHVLGGWIHAHENVAVDDIGQRAAEVCEHFQSLVSANDEVVTPGTWTRKSFDNGQNQEQENLTGEEQVIEDEGKGAGVGTERMKMCNGRRERVRIVHVERVKTFAPGVMHVVFDVFIPALIGVENVVDNEILK